MSAALLGSAQPASASFHLNMVREVYPGSVANPTAEYVEMQAFAPGQNFVSGHAVTYYGPSGAVTGTATFAMNLAHGQTQDTFLVGTMAAATQFGVTPDLIISNADRLSPSGGAVCWDTVDCASWGSFSGSLPSPAGTPAAAIPDGMALRRTIARGCPTALDPADDTNQSAMDFSQTSPQPRNNAMQPSEVLCGGGGGGGPSNAFSFGALTLNKMRGTAMLTVKVPGQGTVKLAGKGVKTAKATSLIAGNVTLPIKPTGNLRMKLRMSGKAKVKISVTFTAVDGSPNTRSEQVKLRKGH